MGGAPCTSASWVTAAFFTAAGSSALPGIGCASTIWLLALARAARRRRAAVRSASATDGALPARMASVAVWRDTVHLRRPVTRASS